jgi:septum site-determining protein MinD
MPTIISTHSFRGGTGKSNTTANLAVLVAKAGNRVAVIDTDIQSPGIHVLFNFDVQNARRSLNDFLWKRCKIEEAAYDVSANVLGEIPSEASRACIYLIPSSLNTGEIARVLREGYDVAQLNDGIQELLQQLNLDYLFIDTHPGVNEETLLSIAISDVLVLMMRPDNQDFQGTAVTVELARRLEVPQMFFILNKIPPGTDTQALRKNVESAFRSSVTAMLPLNNEMARLASSGIFSNQYPDHPFTEELRIAARRLMSIASSNSQE